MFCSNIISAAVCVVFRVYEMRYVIEQQRTLNMLNTTQQKTLLKIQRAECYTLFIPRLRFKTSGRAAMQAAATSDRHKSLVNESRASLCQLTTESRPAEENMANLDVILQELRDFRRENGEKLKEIEKDINK